MPRYEWRGFIYVNADSQEEAQGIVDDTLYAINKDPDGARVSQDDGEPDIDEDAE